jgi:hypothetical protein
VEWLRNQSVDDELADVLDAALPLAGEPLPHLRQPVGRREAHDPAHGRGHRDRLRLAVRPGLVRVLPRIEGQAVADQRKPLRVELRRNVERATGERPVVLLELGEDALGECVVPFRSQKLAEDPLRRDNGSQSFQMRGELLLEELGDRFGLAPELCELLERQRLCWFFRPAHPRLLDATASLAFRSRGSTAGSRRNPAREPSWIRERAPKSRRKAADV